MNRIGHWLAPLLLALAVMGLRCADAAPALSPPVYQALEAIREDMTHQRLAAARRRLEALLRQDRLSAYERAIAWQTRADLALRQSDYPAAARALRRCLAGQALPSSTARPLRRTLGQLLLQLHRTDEAIRVLRDWLRQLRSPRAEDHALLASAYAAARQYAPAVKELTTAVHQARDFHAEWYEALAAMEYQRGRYRACLPWLETLLRRRPGRKADWLRLAAVQLALKDPAAALATLETAHRAGLLQSGDELLSLVRLQLQVGVPYRAARLLAQGMKAGRIRDDAEHRRLLARAWGQARETARAAAALERSLGKVPTPASRLQLARWYARLERWRDLLGVLPCRDRRGADAGRCWLLRGAAHYELGERDDARADFRRAEAVAASRAAARRWLRFLRLDPAAAGTTSVDHQDVAPGALQHPVGG